MAALTMSPSLRQPFASLDAPRMRSLNAKRNLQPQQRDNSLSKRPVPAFSIMDTENLDPARLSSKRKRSSEEDDIEVSKGGNGTKPLKASRMGLSTLSPLKSTVNINTNNTKNTLTTPRKILSQRKNPLSPTKSTPRPAGRSPPPCHSSRRSIAKPTGSAAKSVKRPFSIATALSGGKSKSVSTSTTAKPTPASWSFDIYVDSEQEEMTNLMQHSTCVLDISDDETTSNTTTSTRGKENIPPAELGISLPPPTEQEQTQTPATNTERKTAVARSDKMTEEERSPLGELNAADYYAEDCHAFSYAVVFDDEDENDNVPAAPAPSPVASSEMKKGKGHSRSKLSSVSSISALLEKTAPKETEVEEKAEAEIEIWESGSAVAENENDDENKEN